MLSFRAIFGRSIAVQVDGFSRNKYDPSVCQIFELGESSDTDNICTCRRILKM